jgi:hypothetical protein
MTKTTTFESMSDLIDYARTTPGGSSQRYEGRHDDWFGTATFEEALDLAVTGWDEPRAKVQAIVDRVTPKVRRSLTPRLTRQMGTKGRKVLPNRYAQGHPRHTIQRVRSMEAAHTRTVTILVNGSFSAGVSTEVITGQGAAVLSLIDALHYMGVSTEVWVSRCVQGGPGEYQSAVKVKGFEDQAGTDRLMFAIAHPSMLRRLQFAVMEADREAPRYYGYGTPSAPKVQGMTFDVTIGANPYQVQEAAADPVAWVLTQVDGLDLV